MKKYSSISIISLTFNRGAKFRTKQNKTYTETTLSPDCFRDRLGLFEVAGIKAWLGAIRLNQETLVIPGPIVEELIVMVNITKAPR